MQIARRQLCFRAAIAFLLAFVGLAASAQTISVMPVNIFLQNGEKTATLSVINKAKADTAVQIRAYDWSIQDGKDQLTPTSGLLVSPPLVTIAPGATQIIRMVLRQAPTTQESTYRILVDQIPAASTAGTIRIVLRLSLPVFAEPVSRVRPQIAFHLEQSGDKLVLVGVNSGTAHDVLRNIELTTTDGRKFHPIRGASPYILANSTQRWPIDSTGSLPPSGDSLVLTALGIGSSIHEQVTVAMAH